MHLIRSAFAEAKLQHCADRRTGKKNVEGKTIKGITIVKHNL